MILSNDDVEEILRLLDSSPYDELQLETDRFKLTLRRSGSGWTRETETRGEAGTGDEAQAGAAGTEAKSTETKPADDEDGTVAIRAPLIGTFYRAPKPGAEPFVKTGSRVEADTVVCIIETMKLMNSIPAGVRGEITEICVDNGEVVEQEQMLMRVRGEE